jgi:peptidoglycan hydrolase CwlO-like protein
MEATLAAAPVEDGQQPKSPTKVVSNVLLRSSLFLCNIGLQFASKKSSTTLVSIKVQQLQDQLETERQEKDGLREEVETLQAQAHASQEIIDNMKRSMEENNSLLHQLLSFNRSQVPPS